MNLIKYKIFDWNTEIKDFFADILISWDAPSYEAWLLSTSSWRQ